MITTQFTPPQAALVAIDIAKNRHEVLIDPGAGMPRRRLSVLNNRAEHDRLVATLRDLGRPVIVGFEPTGNYHRVSVVRTFETARVHLEERLLRILRLMLSGDCTLIQASALDGLSFDPFSFQEDSLAAPEVCSRSWTRSTPPSPNMIRVQPRDPALTGSLVRTSVEGLLAVLLGIRSASVSRRAGHYRRILTLGLVSLSGAGQGALTANECSHRPNERARLPRL